jgi:hypothetical protein
MLSINIPCIGYRHDYGIDGYEYECDYETDIECENCVCCIANCGYYGYEE